MTFTIPEFWCGVGATVLVEVVLLMAWGWATYAKQKKP